MFEKIIKKLDLFEMKSKDFVRPQYIKELTGLSESLSIDLLELATKYGYFKKRVNILSPIDYGVIAYRDTFEEIPPVVFDDNFPEEKDKAFHKDKHLKKFTEIVYVLNDEGIRQ